MNKELQDGRLTFFVPSVATPLAGSIYILIPDRVHPLNILPTHGNQDRTTGVNVGRNELG